MSALKSPRREAFAVLMSKGNTTAVSAYRKVTEKPGSGARQIATKWLSKADIRERIAELQARATRKAEFDMSELMEFLAGIVRSEPGKKLNGNARFVNAEYDAKGNVTGYKSADKLKAAKLLAEVCGYLRPDVKDTADQLTAAGGGRGITIIFNQPALFAEPRRLPPRLIELEAPKPEPSKKAAHAA